MDRGRIPDNDEEEEEEGQKEDDDDDDDSENCVKIQKSLITTQYTLVNIFIKR